MRASLESLTALALVAGAFAPASAQQQPAQAPAPAVVQSSAGAIAVERLATLEYPWGMAVLPDGRVLVTEKPGRLRIWDGTRLSGPLAGLPPISHRNDEDQGGLLDVAIDPDFARNGLIYLSYSEAADPQPIGLGETGEARFGEFLDTTDDLLRGAAIARGRLDGTQLLDVQVIWRQVPKTIGRGHFGVRMVFGRDGKLYATSGERMRFDPAQSLASNLGKVIRLNPDGSIPADNPFVGREGALGEIWSYGHRNVLSFGFDDAGRLLALEMGPLGGDELNLIERGKNYGWPVVSNGDNYGMQMIPDHPSHEEFQAPLRSWTPVIAPSGALAYDGDVFPSWRGDVLVGGLVSQALVRLSLEGDRVGVEERIDMRRRIRDVAQAQDGSILLLTDAKQGELLRIRPAPGRGRPPEG